MQGALHAEAGGTGCSATILLGRKICNPNRHRHRLVQGVSQVKLASGSQVARVTRERFVARVHLDAAE